MLRKEDRRKGLANQIHELCSFSLSIIVISKNIYKVIGIIFIWIQEILYFIVRINPKIVECARCCN